LFISLSEFLFAFTVIFCAYIVFGLAGFGTALIAAPLLSLYIPISKIIPLLALLDFSASAITFFQVRKQIYWSELKQLVPSMVVGSLIGASILLYTHPNFLVPFLGIFIIGYSIYSLIFYSSIYHFNKWASVPFGVIGGVFSALFGSGGFLYAIYLIGRLETKESIGATQNFMLKCSTLTRTILFFLAGVYSNKQFILTTLSLSPAMVMGLYIGRHITLKLSKEHFIRIIHCIVLGSGLFLLANYFLDRI
jgi:uncharacterized membrane protein YfcA